MEFKAPFAAIGDGAPDTMYDAGGARPIGGDGATEQMVNNVGPPPAQAPTTTEEPKAGSFGREYFSFGLDGRRHGSTGGDTGPVRSIEQYQKWLDALELAKHLNKPSRIKQLQGQLDWLKGKLGKNEDGTDKVAGLTGMDFTRGDFDLSRAYGLAGSVVSSAKNKAKVLKMIDLMKSENLARENQAYEKNTLNPTFDRMKENADELMNTPTYGADFISQQRSSLMEKIKTGESSRLRRVSAALGLRGIDPSSPAGAALATRTALDADAALADSLREFSMDTEMGNRDGLMQSTALASDVLQKRMSAHFAIQSGDQNKIMGIGDDIASIMEALQQQHAAKMMERNQRHQQAKAMYLDTWNKQSAAFAQMMGGMMGG